jgi:hypothetical protein
VLLGFRFAQPAHTVYMAAALLEHEEIVFCVEPPLGYLASAPETLRTLLCAQVISLPSR